MANSKSYTFTKADMAKMKAKDSAMTPAQKKALSKSLVNANSAANRMKSKGKA